MGKIRLPGKAKGKKKITAIVGKNVLRLTCSKCGAEEHLILQRQTEPAGADVEIEKTLKELVCHSCGKKGTFKA